VPLVAAATKSKAQVLQEGRRCESQYEGARDRCNTLKIPAAEKEECAAAVWDDYLMCLEGVEKGLSRNLKRPAASARIAGSERGTPPPKTKQARSEAGRTSAVEGTQAARSNGGAGEAEKTSGELKKMPSRNTAPPVARRVPAPTPSPKPKKANWVIPGPRQTGSPMR